jgi:predicted anti-sigma-YlaC factor YlaD
MTAITCWWQGDCEETEEHLSDHLEDEVRGLRRRRILRHLARCALCRAAFESLRRTVDELRQLGRAELTPAPQLADVVLQRIQYERGAAQ